MRITKIKISQFRGIPGELEIGFCDKEKTPLSTIIYGENGSGKSSIVDALEFVTQGRIEKSSSIKNPTRPSVFNHSLKPNSTAEVEVTFDNGEYYKRRALVELDGYGDLSKQIISPKEAHDNFKNFPIVLRRNDILSYSIVSNVEKQIYLMKCIYTIPNNKRITSDPEVLELKQNRIFIKNKLRELVRELSQLTSIEQSSIQNNINQLQGFVKNKLRSYSKRRYTFN